MDELYRQLLDGLIVPETFTDRSFRANVTDKKLTMPEQVLRLEYISTFLLLRDADAVRGKFPAIRAYGLRNPFYFNLILDKFSEEEGQFIGADLEDTPCLTHITPNYLGISRFQGDSRALDLTRVYEEKVFKHVSSSLSVRGQVDSLIISPV